MNNVKELIENNKEEIIKSCNQDLTETEGTITIPVTKDITTTVVFEYFVHSYNVKENINGEKYISATEYRIDIEPETISYNDYESEYEWELTNDEINYIELFLLKHIDLPEC